MWWWGEIYTPLGVCKKAAINMVITAVLHGSQVLPRDEDLLECDGFATFAIKLLKLASLSEFWA